MRLIYISNSNTSVLESQVLELMKYYAEHGVEVRYLQGYRNETEKVALLEKFEPYREYVNPNWFVFYPCYRFFHSKIKASILAALQRLDGWQDAVIHARDEPMGAVLMELKREGMINNPILSEFRSSGTIEMPFYVNHASFKRRILSLIMLRYFKYTDKTMFKEPYVKGVAVTSISPTINSYFRKLFPSTRMPFYYNPNVAGDIFAFSNEKRIETRKKMGFKDDDVVVVCSTGGGSIWQQDHLVIPYLVKSGFKVVNLSKFNVDIPGVITMKVPFKEMPAMLSAADAAILWRERTMLNFSASPTKFSEFVAMGLCVIHNKSVDVATEYIKSTGNGMLVDDVNEIDAEMLNLLRKKSAERERVSQEGRHTFGMEQVANTYLKVYKDLSIMNNK